MSVFGKNRCYAFQGTTYYVIRLEMQRGHCLGMPFVHLFLTFTLYDRRVFKYSSPNLILLYKLCQLVEYAQFSFAIHAKHFSFSVIILGQAMSGVLCNTRE
jgi:hypothetical protein